MCWELPVTERTNTKKSLFWRLVGGLALGWGGWVKGLLVEEYHYGTILPSHLRVGAARGQMCWQLAVTGASEGFGRCRLRCEGWLRDCTNPLRWHGHLELPAHLRSEASRSQIAGLLPLRHFEYYDLNFTFHTCQVDRDIWGLRLQGLRLQGKLPLDILNIVNLTSHFIHVRLTGTSGV